MLNGNIEIATTVCDQDSYRWCVFGCGGMSMVWMVRKLVLIRVEEDEEERFKIV